MIKPDTQMVMLKGLCYFIIGGFTPLTTGLAQWANSGEWPSRLVWIIIIGSCITGSATQLLSFLSGSYSNYVAGRAGKSDDTTQFLLSKTQATKTP